MIGGLLISEWKNPKCVKENACNDIKEMHVMVQRKCM
jgi:hypothetical protein